MIRGKSVRLRAVEQEDHTLIQELLGDPECQALFQVSPVFPPSRLDVANLVERLTDSEHCLFIVEAGEQPVGFIAATFDLKNRTAALAGTAVKPGTREKGYGFEARLLLLKFLFHDLGMVRVQTEVLTINERIVHLCRKSGFVHEGTRRSAAFKAGLHLDLELFSMLRSEFDERWGSPGTWPGYGGCLDGEGGPA